MNALYAALFGWAVHLSGYPYAAMPEVVRVEHHWLEQEACGGRPCKVLGWHRQHEDKVYLDNSLDLQDTFQSSIAVHEFVHYLQGVSGKYALEPTCSESVDMEREAYGVQERYLVAYGIYHPITALHTINCGQ